MPPTDASSTARLVPQFQLHWTIGFAGKRMLHDDFSQRPAAEAKAARALSQAVQFLHGKAAQQDSILTAVSSIARGADVLFARTCLNPDTQRPAIPWKCLLPFSVEDFIRLDLAEDASGEPLHPDEVRQLRQDAESCLEKAYETDAGSSTPCGAADDAEQRVVAYLECGYRTVDESDVMICLLNGPEFRNLVNGDRAHSEAPEARQPAVPVQSLKAGTLAVARYAIAARRPCIVLNLDADDPWHSRKMFDDSSEEAAELFVDPVVSGLVHRARDPFALPADWGEMPPGPDTDSRRGVLQLQKRLEAIANRHQKRAVGGLKWMLSLHLTATGIAALAATVLHANHNGSHSLAMPLAVGALVLAFTKPGLAFVAQQIEHRLHHHGDHGERDQWLHARELAQLCRGALSLWPLPIQPLDAADEEDFPKLKRLLRTLRLIRALDRKAAVSDTRREPAPDASRPWEGETQLEADMRAASELYVAMRLDDQAAYYREQHKHSHALERRWHRVYRIAIWSAIGCGLVLALLKLLHVPQGSHSYTDISNWLTAAVIITPFAATYALGMTTILDCRRRSRRYKEMHHYLARLARTLKSCQANSSRLRIIEHAERMMIEEQHEWFSVTRNYSV